MSLADSGNALQELGWMVIDGPLKGKFILSSDYQVSPGFTFKYGGGEDMAVYTLSTDGLFVLREDVLEV